MKSLNKKIAKKIKNNRDEWAREIRDYHYSLIDGIPEKYNSEQEKHFLQDIKYHLMYLSESISLSNITLFENYISWTKVLFDNIGLEIDGLKTSIKCTEEILAKKLNKDEKEILNKFINKGIEIADKDIEEPESYLEENNPYYELAKDYLESLLNENREYSSKLIMEAVDNGIDVKDIYLNVFQPVQREIGRLWQLNKLSVAKEHYATSVTQLIMSQLYPYILGGETGDCTCITTCVGDELHELGIRMIADLMEMDGWNTVHLGANTPNNSIINELIEKNADLLGISVTITKNIDKAIELIKDIRNEKKLEDIKIMVGGYPFNVTDNLWQEIGADGYAPEVEKAIELADDLCRRGGRDI